MGLNQCFKSMVLVKVSGAGSFLSLLFALVLGLVCKPISPSSLSVKTVIEIKGDGGMSFLYPTF